MLTAFLWILEVNASKEEKRACPFSSLTPRRKKTAKSVCKVWVSKLAESDEGSYYNHEKWLKDDKASEKPIETTAKSSFLGRKAAKRATNSRPVPCHIKIGRRTFLKVYCSGRAASRKTPGSGLLSIFPGKCRSFRNMYRVKVGLAQNENCSSQITKDAFSTTEGSNRAERLK